jgi:hypothetical protein
MLSLPRLLLSQHQNKFPQKLQALVRHKPQDSLLLGSLLHRKVAHHKACLHLKVAHKHHHCNHYLQDSHLLERRNSLRQFPEGRQSNVPGDQNFL